MLFDIVALIQTVGYVGITLIIFAESGLFFGFFLPGDSLLFTAGVLASQGLLDIQLLVVLVVLAAIAGDSVGYWFGKKVGPVIFNRPDSRFFSKKRLDDTKRFFDEHGAKSIVLARFIPAVRTFTPILAGVGSMQYGVFITYNILGSFLWAACIPLLGYFLGSYVPNVDQYLLPIILLIVLTSFVPIFFSRKKRKP